MQQYSMNPFQSLAMWSVALKSIIHIWKEWAINTVLDTKHIDRSGLGINFFSSVYSRVKCPTLPFRSSFAFFPLGNTTVHSPLGVIALANFLPLLGLKLLRELDFATYALEGLTTLRRSASGSRWSGSERTMEKICYSSANWVPSDFNSQIIFSIIRRCCFIVLSFSFL